MNQKDQPPKHPSDAVVAQIQREFSIVNGVLCRAKSGFSPAPVATIVKGYLRVSVAYQSIAAHHIVWLLAMGRWPAKQLDHINRVKTDNRITNLREATSSENMLNRGLQANSTSGLRNVSWHKATGKWQAHLKRGGRKQYLGLHPTKEAAALAVERASEGGGFSIGRDH